MWGGIAASCQSLAKTARDKKWKANRCLVGEGGGGGEKEKDSNIYFQLGTTLFGKHELKNMRIEMCEKDFRCQATY